MLLRLSGLFATVAVSAAVIASQNPYYRVPDSGIERPEDVGVSAHTNYLIYTGPPQWRHGVPPLMAMDPSHGPSAFPMFDGPAGYTPADIRSAYGTDGPGYGAIAVVVAYDYPNALRDFNTFSSTFGLPVETSNKASSFRNSVFQVVYAQGGGTSNAGWNGEAAMDMEWAHSMAPNAKIYLVIARNNQYGNLFAAVDLARQLRGVTQVSLSWGGTEWRREVGWDPILRPWVSKSLRQYNPTIFAAAGDDGGVVLYPSASPYVVSCGGTSLELLNGTYDSETGWDDSGGGPSEVEPRPAYQNGIFGLVHASRGTPDIAAVADPDTGCAVRINGVWDVFGGTSLATPILAGIANAGDARRGERELDYIYAHTNGFHDIIVGNNGYPCLNGWDFVTGWGSPITDGSL